MVLVFDKLRNYTSILQTKISYREGYEAGRVGLETMPLDQHIEGGHGEREARLKIRPAPMHHLLHMTDERQHREHRLDEHAILPLPPLTQFETHSRWVGARRVTLRHVSSRPPFSTGRAAFTASGAAPEVLLQAYPRASVSIAVASTDVHPCVSPLRQPPLTVRRGNSVRVRWVLGSPLNFVRRPPPG